MEVHVGKQLHRNDHVRDTLKAILIVSRDAMKTKSEEVFESFLTLNCLPFQKVEEVLERAAHRRRNSRTPEIRVTEFKIFLSLSAPPT
jgi:hypothetical protein